MRDFAHEHESQNEQGHWRSAAIRAEHQLPYMTPHQDRGFQCIETIREAQETTGHASKLI